MKQKAFYALIIAACIAGSSGLFIKEIKTLSPGAIAWLRAAFPALLLIVWLFYKRLNCFHGNYPKMLLSSFINAGRMYLYLIAFIYTSIGNAVILFYTWPIFATILGIFFLKEKVSRKQIALMLLAFIGLGIAYSNKSFSFEDRDFIGMVSAVIASFGYAITVVLFKSEANNYHRNEIIFYQNFAGVLVFLPIFWTNAPLGEMKDFGFALGYAFVIGIVVFSLFFYGLKYLKASTASSIMYLEVVSAIAFGYLLLGEKLDLNMIIGGLIIILSSYFITRLKAVS